jgi:hypothetical protein
VPQGAKFESYVPTPVDALTPDCSDVVTTRHRRGDHVTPTSATPTGDSATPTRTMLTMELRCGDGDGVAVCDVGVIYTCLVIFYHKISFYMEFEWEA